MSDLLARKQVSEAVSLINFPRLGCLKNTKYNLSFCYLRKVMDIIKSQEQGRDVHEQFHDQLERTQDGFALVADYFARGVFNKVCYKHLLCPKIVSPLQTSCCHF